ncbi:hypothetical protein HMPREF0043_00188 [Actinobaculum sp. oral taxon 183 str. F0552]|nr:hypothetical protein HMPREF0043_00188 [Actinobaculum sp. oral taxon 183 str. F0552]
MKTDKDHPRIRGEHDSQVMAAEGRTGSSPHTRGAPSPEFSECQVFRIIPAYAGSTRSCSGLTCSTGDHPRIRGEHS